MATKKYKLKTKLEDFYVEERQEIEIGDNGGFCIFKLEKMGIDTVSALRISSKHLQAALANIGYSGLKDRYSHSVQYISIPSRELGREYPIGEVMDVSDHLKLQYLGRCQTPLKLGDHTSNFFRITIRRLNPENLEVLKNNIELLSAGSWVPNYFDSQKFGFIIGPGGFFAGAYLRGDYEQALKLVIANPNRKERPRSKKVHRFIQDNWGDWQACYDFLAEDRFENYHDIIAHLVKDPGDMHGAVKLISRDKMKLKVTSIQAYIWNEYLRSLLTGLDIGADMVGVKYHVGELLFPDDLTAFKNASDAIRTQFADGSSQGTIPAIPLPSPDVGEPLRSEYNELLEKNFGIESIDVFDNFKELGISTSTHRRPLLFKPADLLVEEEGQDRAIKRKKNHFCTLTFELPPGSYATVMIKALMLA